MSLENYIDQFSEFEITLNAKLQYMSFLQLLIMKLAQVAAYIQTYEKRDTLQLQSLLNVLLPNTSPTSILSLVRYARHVAANERNLGDVEKYVSDVFAVYGEFSDINIAIAVFIDKLTVLIFQNAEIDNNNTFDAHILHNTFKNDVDLEKLLHRLKFHFVGMSFFADGSAPIAKECLLMDRSVFSDKISEILHSISPDKEFDNSDSILFLQYILEDWVIHYFWKMQYIAKHCRKATITADDVNFAQTVDIRNI